MGVRKFTEVGWTPVVFGLCIAFAAWLVMPHESGGGFAYPIAIPDGAAEHGEWFSVSTSDGGWAPKGLYVATKYVAWRAQRREAGFDSSYEGQAAAVASADAAWFADRAISDHGSLYGDPFGGPQLRTWLSRGPSSGLPLALAGIDIRTPGDLTGGRRVAGTGTVDTDGNVGPIFGAAYKVRAAEYEGVEVVFVPRDNYEEAAHAVVGKSIEVVPVDHVYQAVEWLCADSDDAFCRP